MAPWDHHQMHPSIEYEKFLGYPNKIDIRWLEDCPKFKGLAIDHVAKFVKYIWDLGVEHEDCCRPNTHLQT
jgi:hypothetical protein